MMNKNTLFLLLATLMAFNANAQGKLTLSDALTTALKNSYNIQLAKNNADIATINNNLAVAGGMPIVTGQAIDNEQVTSINQKFPDPARNVQRGGVAANNLSASITGSILLYNGMRVKATKKRLEELQNQNIGLLNAQIQNTLAGVTTRYFDIVRQQHFLKTILQSLEVAKKRIEIIQSRKEVGMANDADLFQAQLDLNALTQSQQAQQLIIDQSKTDLLNLIFVRPDSSISIQDTITVDQSITFDQIKLLLEKNPQIIAANQQIKINEWIEKETAAGFILTNQSFGPTVGLNLSVPIYNGSVNKKQQQVAAINTRSAIAQKNNLLLSAETGAVKTYQLYRNSLEQLSTAKTNFELSAQLLSLVMQKFELGQATIVDVKIAQQSFENESYRMVNLSYSAKMAEIELKRLANLLQP
jgi:outer membrane protein TolC